MGTELIITIKGNLCYVYCEQNKTLEDEDVDEIIKGLKDKYDNDIYHLIKKYKRN